MQKEKENLVVEHMHLADAYAKKLHRRIPKYITLDELKSAAYEGLIHATKNYDFSRPFFRYASSFVYGSIIDYIRNVSKSRCVKNAVKFTSMDEMKNSDDTPLSSSIGFEENNFDHTSEFFSNLKNILNERELIVIQEYFVNNLFLSEIGNILNVKESRASQIFMSAKKKIRKFILSNKENKRSFAYDVSFSKGGSTRILARKRN